MRSTSDSANTSGSSLASMQTKRIFGKSENSSVSNFSTARSRQLEYRSIPDKVDIRIGFAIFNKKRPFPIPIYDPYRTVVSENRSPVSAELFRILDYSKCA